MRQLRDLWSWRLLRLRRSLRCRLGSVQRRVAGAPLGTWTLLVLVAVAMVSAFVTVVLQDSALSADLSTAGHARLARAATLADHLLGLHVAARREHYRALAATPQLQANLESRHPPTLTRFATELAAQQRAGAVWFLDPEQHELAAVGDASLGARVRARLPTQTAAAADTEPAFLVHGSEVYAWLQAPVRDGTAVRGHLLVLEALRPEQLAAWSALCGGELSIGAPLTDNPGSLGVRLLDGLELCVSSTFAAEREALANSRANLLAGGLIGVAFASATSLFLARRLLRPLRTIHAATERIGRGDLEFRLPEARRDEIGDLARAFNLMLDRLQHNIDQRLRAEQQVRHLAWHDGLTGLCNRRMLKGELTSAIAVARQQATSVGVIHLGLDRFKIINETLGHALGDELLVEVARRLEQWLRAAHGGDPHRLLARLAGDEFVVLLPRVDDRRQVEELAGRLLEAMAAPFDLRGQSLPLSLSLGIALSPQDAQDPEALLRGSDLALAQAKLRGGGGIEFFADSMQEIAARRLALDQELQQALANREFELHYQPKLDLRTGQVHGVEALLRWRNGRHGLVGPDEFIPLAEETGAIVAIGAWVLRAAMLQACAWQQAGLPRVKVAVNVSARQIQHGADFVAQVAALLGETGLDPALLDLEITESVLLQGAEPVIALFHSLRQMGVGLALDDFGTGYSSLSQLRNLPIDTLKLDRSFLVGVDTNPESASLIGSIIGMAKMLDLRVVVEGVETRKQRRLLTDLGCDEIQGFLVHRPLAADEATAVLRRRRPARSRKTQRKPARARGR